MNSILKKHSGKLFLLVSIIIHILIFSSNHLKEILLLSKSNPENKTIIEIVTIPNEKLQVVDRQLEANEKTPIKSNFLSNKNNTVSKETKAKLSHLNKRKKIISQKNRSLNNKREEFKKDDLLVFKDKENSTKLKEKLYDFSDLNDLGVIPQTEDYLPETLEGEKNALNTRQFLYFSYYERIKKRLGMFWTPAIEDKFRILAFSNVKLESKNLVTKLIIVLDDNGFIREIEKIGSSGYVELDNAAVEAFNRAAPFSNPPKGILDENNNIILKWDFILTS
jgi:hypothetical protein